jgi:ADP-ribosyl-[dinitrogen reductase] hydrolase
MADTSGNGCIMRMAPCIIWNRNNLSAAIGESVAQALLTHGSSDCITYTAALAHELWEGKALTQYDHLRNRSINNSGYVADTYASAWHSVKTTKSFHAAIVDAINRGEDADTVGAVTGMIAGRIYGIDFNISNLQIINNKRIDEFHQLFINRHN